MTIETIDRELCSGCGICILSCPMDVIRLDPEIKKALICYPEECMLCGQCRRFCPQGAVRISSEKFQPVPLAWS